MPNSKPLRHATHLAVYLILQKGDQILMGLRQNTGFMDGLHGLPSGHLERGESAIEALHREVKEEVGIDLHEVELVHVSHTQTNHDYLNLFFECESWSGEISNPEPDKCGGWEFFPKGRLPPTTIPYLAKMLTEVKEGKRYAERGWKR